jgi:hypothetical protein
VVVKGARERNDENAWSFLLVVFAISRLFFFGVGIAATALLPPMALGKRGDNANPVGFLEPWANWDGVWYSLIATEGYSLENPDSTAFFPLFPLLIRGGTLLGASPALSGILVSLIACFFAFFFLYQIAKELWDQKTARATTLCFAFFPTAFYLNAVYTEALFIALSTGSFWAARVQRNLLLAASLGALAAATRNLGVLLLIPLASEWLRSRREFGWSGLWLGLVPTGLLAYMSFLWARFGNPFITVERQAFWGRHLQNPLTILETAWKEAIAGLNQVLDPATLFLYQGLEPSMTAAGAIYFVLFTLFFLLLVVGVAFLLRVPKGLWVYTLLLVLIPVLSTSTNRVLTSTSRYELAAFPIFFVLGWLFSQTSLKPALWVWLLVSGAIGVAEAALFITGRWVV